MLKIKKYILIFVIISLSCFLISRFLDWASSRDFISLYSALRITIYLLLVFIVIIFSVKELRKYIVNHSTITNILLIACTIIITLSAYSIDGQNQYYNINSLLATTNEINILVAEDILNTGNVWTNFVLQPYEENIGFITKNFTDVNCVSNYYAAMMNMQTINNINNNRRELSENIEKSNGINSKLSLIIEQLKGLNNECHYPPR